MLFAAALLWSGSALAGYLYIFRYESKPATLASAARHWPEGSGLNHMAGAFELVMVVHPRCPCTRASVAELNKLLLRFQGKLRAHALVLKPFETSEAWGQTEISARLAQMPYLETVKDYRGATAERFGALISGETLLYGPTGTLLFDGGLTAFRGHEGPSLGQTLLSSMVAGSETGFHQTKVFGCSIKDKVCPHENDSRPETGQTGGTHASQQRI